MKKCGGFRITKVLGIFMVAIGAIGLASIAGLENPKHPILQSVYMISFLAGGIFNIAEFGNWAMEAMACFFYLFATVFSLINSAVISRTISGDTGLMLIMFSVSFLRTRKLYKANGSKLALFKPHLATDATPAEMIPRSTNNVAPLPPPVIHPPVDVQRIIKDEETWRRQQRGLTLTPIEDELDRIDGMDGHTFEHWCAKLLKKNGFTDVEVTKGSGDQGVDVLAVREGKRYAIQCKRYSQKLGNKPVQEVYAGKTIYGCSIAVVLTNNYFTEGAKEAAKATGVELWDRDTLRRMLDYSNYKAIV